MEPREIVSGLRTCCEVIRARLALMQTKPEPDSAQAGSNIECHVKMDRINTSKDMCL